MGKRTIKSPNNLTKCPVCGRQPRHMVDFWWGQRSKTMAKILSHIRENHKEIHIKMANYFGNKRRDYGAYFHPNFISNDKEFEEAVLLVLIS